MSENPFADLIPKKSAGSDNPFADLIPEAPPQKTAGDFFAGNTDAIATNAYKTAAGVGEAGLSMLTGLGAFPVSKAGGIYELLRNINDPRASEKAKEFEEFLSQFYTYQPRTELGQDIMGKTGRLVMEPAFGMMREMGETPAHDIATNPLLMAATGGKSADYEGAIKYVGGTAAEFGGPAVAHTGIRGVRGYIPERAPREVAPGAPRTKEQVYRQRLMEDFNLLDEQAKAEAGLEYPPTVRGKAIEMPWEPDRSKESKAQIPGREDLVETAGEITGMDQLEIQAGRLEGKHIDRMQRQRAADMAAKAEAEAERARQEGYQEGEAAAVGQIPEIPPEEVKGQPTEPAKVEPKGLEDIPTSEPGPPKTPRKLTQEEILLRQDPLYSLMADIKKGGGIDMGSLLKDYGAETVRGLHKRFPGIVQRKGRYKLDELADEHGYADGDTLINAMLDSPSVKLRAKQLKEEFDNSPMGQQMALAKKGFTPAPKEGIIAADLQKGDQVIIGGEKYKVHGEAKGNVILKDGKTLKVDMFDRVQAEGIKQRQKAGGVKESAPKYEKTGAEDQAVLGGMSQAETFGLRPGETEWGKLDESAPGTKQKGQGELFGEVKEEQGKLDLSTPRGSHATKPAAGGTDGSVLHPPELEPRQVGDYKTHTTKIEGIQDVAEIAAANGAHLAKEHLTAIITDTDGNILRVYRHSIGDRGSASANIGELAGNLMNTPDGAKMWLVHNHPRGLPRLSAGDSRALLAVRNLVSKTGADVVDIIATTPDHFGTSFGDTIPLQKPEMKSTLPVLERVYKDRGHSPVLNSSNKFITYADTVLKNKDGIIITDGNHSVCAVISVKDFNTLKGDVAKSILTATDKTNGTQIIAVAQKGLAQDALANIQRFANNANLRFLDAIMGPERKSLRKDASLYHDAKDSVRGVDRGDISFYANPLTPVVKGFGNMIKNFMDKNVAKRMPGAVRGTGESFFHTLRRTVQDERIAIKDFEKGIEKTYRILISKKESTYETWDRTHGKVAEHINEFNRGYVQPFVKQLAEVSNRLNTNLDEFDLYLKAKYSPTRNDIIAKRNPDLAAQGPGSGMSDAQAATILGQLQREGKTQAFEQLADMIYKVQDMKLKLIEKYGLESAEVLADMKAQHGKYYVPLKGKAGVPGQAGGGNTINVRSSGLRSAVGRLTPSENAIIHTFDDFEATIRRVHNNEVTKSFIDIAEKYQPQGIEVNKVQLKQKYNPDTGIVETYNTPIWSPEENTISGIRMVKDAKGKDVAQHVFVRINDHPLLLRALKSENIGFGMADQVISKIGGITRTVAGLCTRWSPEFWVTNFERDIGDALQSIASEHKTSVVKDVVKNVPSAMKAMYDYYRGKPGTGRMDLVAREFTQNGGTVGFYSFKDFDQRLISLERQIRAESRTGAAGYSARTAKNIFDVIGDITSSGENAVRLSVYKALRDNGKSIEEAVAYAKNVTVNFNRHGEHRWISQLYMFANPGIQGIHRFAQVAGTKKGMAIMTGILATSMAVSEANRMIAGEDEDGINRWDKISPWEKTRHLIIMRPDSDKPAIKIPLGFYSRIPFGTGNAISDLAHGVKEPMDIGATMFDTTLDAFNPLGSGSPLQSLVPTAARPFVDVATNRNAFGQPIMPEQGFGPKKPDSQLAFKSVSPLSKGISEGLNTATGGSPWESGAIDVSPESIDYTVKFFTGGPGKNAQQLLKIGTKFYENGGDIKATSEELTAQDIPFVGRVTGSRTEYQTQQKFYETTGKAEQKYAEWKGRRTSDKGFEKFDEEHGEEAWAGKRVNRYREQLTKINEDIKTIQEDTTFSATERGELLKQYQKEKDDLMKEYIREYNEAQKEQKKQKKAKPGIFDNILRNTAGGA